MSGTSIQNAEGVILVTLIVAYVFWLVISKLGQSRPGFRIGLPIAVGFGIRLAAIIGISATGLDATLRGGDETTFLDYARSLAAQPLGRGDLPHGHLQLHTVLFALQLKLGFLTVGALRITQIGIAMLGVILILGAVYDLADARAARFAAWLLALEPTSIFFNSALHKEPNMELAAGLVVFGGSMIWRRLDVRGIALCALGGLIAVETRSYAGWFLVSAAVLVLLHAAVRNMNRPLRAMPAIYAVIIVAVLATPADAAGELEEEPPGAAAICQRKRDRHRYGYRACQQRQSGPGAGRSFDSERDHHQLAQAHPGPDPETVPLAARKHEPTHRRPGHARRLCRAVLAVALRVAVPGPGLRADRAASVSDAVL